LVSLHLSPPTALLSLVAGFRHRGLNSANFKTALPNGENSKGKNNAVAWDANKWKGTKGTHWSIHLDDPSHTEPNNRSHHLKPKPPFAVRAPRAAQIAVQKNATTPNPTARGWSYAGIQTKFAYCQRRRRSHPSL
jgi:hypothetical protein